MTQIVHTFPNSNLDFKEQLESCKDFNVYVS